MLLSALRSVPGVMLVNTWDWAVPSLSMIVATLGAALTVLRMVPDEDEIAFPLIAIVG